MSKIQLPLAFKEIIESTKPYICIPGGRLGGKTNNTALMAILIMLSKPYTDIIVARVSYGSMADSSYAEIEHALQQFPEFIDEFTLKKSPLRIERKNDSGTIYFIGYGGSNTSRTKSIRTRHPISMVILEETQELKERRNLDEALASFRRRFNLNVKVCILGNPPPQAAHWFNKFIKEKEQDLDWLVKYMSWKDIVPFINDYDLKEILKTKMNDPDYYNWFYMGQTTGSFGSVYPMFKPSKHMIKASEWDTARTLGGLRVLACIIGGDGAVNRDATSFVPLLLLNNGQSLIGPIFYHNPKDDGVIGYHQLVQDHLTRWFDNLCAMFRMGTRKEIMEHPNMQTIPIWMRIDSAAPDLIQECRFFLGGRAMVGPIKKPHVEQMVGVCQSALANNNVVIMEYGQYYSYVKNKWIKTDLNILAEQISNLIWNEQQTNYDPIVPNDVCDAWTYATYTWYSNAENIQYFNIMKANNIQTRTISDILKGKE